MFGVLWMNLYGWYGAWQVTTSDQVILWVAEWAADSRFYSLLGFLFGIGFAIQLQRASADDSQARGIFLKRMLALLGFGLVHGLFIWSGDILTVYALLGFLLLLYRGLSQRRLVVGAALTYLLLPYIIPKIFFLLRLPVGFFGFFHGKAGASILRNGTFAQIAAYRIQDFVIWRLRGTATSGGFAPFLTLFLLGMLATRWGILSKLSENTRQNRKWLLWVLGWSLVCMAAGIYWLHSLETWWPVQQVSQRPTWHDLRFWSLRGTFWQIGNDLQVWGNSAAYASVLAFLALRPGWNRRLSALAAVGRMPLTTYLTQSIICTTLFYGYGFGLFGRVMATGILEITLAIFAIQLVASYYWLQHYRFGPAEWLWRSVAYARPQPMRRLSPSVAVQDVIVGA
jgi:uncharacterized protein